MRHFSVVVPLLLAFSSHGYGGALGKLFCPTICNPNPKEPLSTCFYKCGFLKYGKYFDGSRCWYLVGTGKIINSKGYCNQGICLKVFTTGYEGSPAQRNCEVHQTKVPSKGETGVKGSKFNVTQASEHGPSENYTMNDTKKWNRFSLEPNKPVRTPNIPHTKGGLTESHEDVTVTRGSNTAAPPAGLATAAPPAELMTAPPPADLTKTVQPTEETMFAPTAGLTTAAPPAGITSAALPTQLTTGTLPAELTTVEPLAGLTTATQPPELMTVEPPAGPTTAPPPAELKKAAPSAGITTPALLAQLTTAVPAAGRTTAAPLAELTTIAPPAVLTMAAQPVRPTTAPPPTELTKAAPPGGITTATPLAQLTTAVPAAGRTTAAPLEELTTIAQPAGFTMAAQPAGPMTAPLPTELTKAAPPARITTTPPPSTLMMAAPPAGLTEAQASTHDKRNAPHFVEATDTTSTSREHIAITTKESVSLSTLSPELPLATDESTVPPAALSATVLSPSSTDRHQKGTSPKEAEISTATTTEMPVNTEQSPTTVLDALTSSPATEHGPSKNYTTNATTEWPVFSLEPTALPTPPNIPFTKADLSEAHEVVTVTLGTSATAPPARGTQVQAPTHDQKNGSYSVSAAAVTSTSKEHINTTAKESAPLSTSSPELALTTEETIVPTTRTSTTVLSPGSTETHLKGTSPKLANTSIETTSEPPVNTDQSSTTILSPLTHAPEVESHTAPRRPAPLEGNLFEDDMATINSHISSVATETTKASDKANITTPISIQVFPDLKKLSENTSGKFTQEKFATIVEALSDAGTNWFRTVSGKRPRHEQPAPQAATTPESNANRGASGGSVSPGSTNAPTSAPIKKSETQPTAETITNTTVSAILPQATTPSHVAQNVSTGASNSLVPIYSMLIAPVIIITNYYCFEHE